MVDALVGVVVPDVVEHAREREQALEEAPAPARHGPEQPVRLRALRGALAQPREEGVVRPREQLAREVLELGPLAVLVIGERALDHRAHRADGVVPVGLREHRVAAEHEDLGGDFPLLSHRDPVAAGAHAERVEEARAVVVPTVAHTHVDGVALKVVRLVGVDPRGDDATDEAAHRGGLRVGLSGDEVDHVLRIAGEVLVDDGGDRAVAHKRGDLSEQDAGRQVLVPRGVEPLVVQRLEAVREGVVAEVVEERGEQARLDVALRQARRHVRIAEEREQVASRHVEHAKRVLEARVHGARVDEVRGPELPDTAQALERRVIDDLDDPPRERDAPELRDPDRPVASVKLRRAHQSPPSTTHFPSRHAIGGGTTGAHSPSSGHA